MTPGEKRTTVRVGIASFGRRDNGACHGSLAVTLRDQAWQGTALWVLMETRAVQAMPVAFWPAGTDICGSLRKAQRGTQGLRPLSKRLRFLLGESIVESTAPRDRLANAA